MSSLNKIGRGSTSQQHYNITEHEDFDESSIYEDFVDDGSVRRYLAKSPVTKTRYEEYQSATGSGHSDHFPVVHCCSTSPVPTSDNYMSATSRQSGRHKSRSKSRSRLNANEILSTDFYSFESTAESYHTADDFEESKPHFSKQLTSISCYEGDTAILECTIAGNPPADMKWYRWDNTLIHDSPDFIYLREKNNVHKLVIREAIPQDSGVYKLVASNIHGQAVSTCKVYVKEDLTDHDDTIIDQLNYTELQYRSDNTDNDVFEEEYLHISEDNSAGSPVMMSGHEFYESASSRGNSRQQIRRVITPISEHQTKPKFLKLFESHTVNENSALLLQCQVFGEPMPTIVWHKDGRELRNNGRVVITHSNNGASQLFISRTLVDDAGIYQVTASNDHGIAVYHSQVSVKPSEDFANNVFISNYYQQRDSDMLTSNDVFRKTREFVPERVASSGEQVAKLKCQVSGENVQVNWLKNESVINIGQNSRYRTINEGNERMLIVNDVQDVDDGEYICQSGKYRVTLLLNVNEEPENVFMSPMAMDDCPIYFSDDHHFLQSRRQSQKLISPSGHKLTSTKDIYINQGVKSAELKCKVLNENTRVEWLKNNCPLQASNKYEVVSRGTDRVLLIKNPVKADDGDYVCQSGKHKVTLNLTVNPGNSGITPHMYSSEDDSIFVRNSQRTTGRDTELVYFYEQDAALRCQVCDEQEQVVWLKENTHVPFNQAKYSMVEDGAYRILNVKNLEPRDSGNYFCQSANNKASTIGFKLNVKAPKTELFEPLKDIKVSNSSEKVVFEIVTQTPRSVPPSKVKWYKDGMEVNECTDSRYTVFSYFNDNKADGAILNFNKLVIDPPLSQQYDQGEYKVVINSELSSNAHLYFDHSAMGFKPAISNVKKSQLQGFQNLISTNNNQQETFTSQTTVPMATKAPNELSFVKELEAFTEVVEGHDCVLECIVNRFETKALWYIENHQEPINYGNTKYELLNQDGRKHKLIIRKATPNDNALYTCRINDQIQTNTFVTVSEDVPLKISEGLPELVHVPEHETGLELSLVMNKKFRHDKAHGTLIRWYLNKKEMKAGPDYEHFCVDNRIVLKYLREILYANDNNANIECRVMEIKPGVHNVELVSKCRMVVDQIGQQGAFIKRLEDFSQCDSGLHLDLEVRVNFNPQLVKWFKNNAQIMSDQHYQLMDDPINRSYILRLKCARLKDSGVYTVDVDGLQCSGEVKVVETPLQFIQALQDQFFDLENDTSLTLDCQLNKPPAQFNIKPRWFKNDLEIVVAGGQVSKYDMIEEHNIVALIIYDLEERDEGRYRCQIGNESTQCRVKPEYILTKYLPNYVEQRETETTTLSFAVNRPLAGVYSTPVTKWFKDSHQINEAASSGKYSFIEQGTERTLVIHNCTPADSGLYKAYIVDESGEEPVNLVTTNSCQVQIKKLKVDFISALEPAVSVYEDETVKLYCEVLPENLKPQWFINNVPINQQNNREMYSTQTQHFLIINNAKESIDAGIYKVKFGHDQTSACQVTVHKRPDNQQQANSAKPEFVLHLKDVKCNEGDNFVLEAGIHRSFTSTDLIEWKKNGEFLVNSVGNSLNRFNENLFTDSEFELSCSGNKCTLSFKNAKRHDAGQYEINIVELDAIPEPGREPMVMKSKCSVSITSYVEKSEIVKPLVKLLKVNEGETIRLECSFNKRPERVDWTRNGQLLAPIQTASDSCVKISDMADGKTQTLEITLCHVEHEGTYQIAADDKIAICEVKVKPVMAQFVQRPPDSIVYDTVHEMEDGNDTCSIECTVDKKNAVVKWYRGNLEIIPGQTVDKDKFELVNEGPIRCLLIHDVNEEDCGDYFCSLGSDFSQTKLTVIEAKPAVIEPLQQRKAYEPKYEKIDVYEGKGLVMGIDLDSAEQSQKCQWFKSEQPLDISTPHIISKIVDSKKHTLKIDKLALADTGRFELIMTEAGSRIKLAAIDLNVMEKPIAITKKLNAQKVQNNLLLLECEVNKPITAQFKYAWSKDNVEITSDDDHLSCKIVEGTKCRLFINKFDYVDSGTYEFTIHDPKIPELKESTSFRLDIKQNPFKSGMRVVNGDFSQTRILTIEFETVNDKYEVKDMKWLKDNAPMDIAKNHKYNFVKIAPCKFTLEIKDVGSVDNGAYNCMIDEFTNKLNLSGIENVENQAISEEIEEAVEELAEVIQGIEEAKNAQANIIDELQDILDKDTVDKSQVLTHAAELVEKEKSVHKLEDLAEEEAAEPMVVEPVESQAEVVAEKSNLKKTESLVSLTEEVNPSQEVAELAPLAEETPEQVKAKSVEKPELARQETKEKEPTMVKEAEANEPAEEATDIAPAVESTPEQAEAKSVEKPELEKQETRAKEPVKVEPVEEVNPEEEAEELVSAEKPSDAEKAAESEVKESEDMKQAEEVQETKRDVEVVKSTWSPEIKLNEGDALNLEVTIKAAVKPADVVIYKNGVALKPSEFTVKKSGDNTDIRFTVKKARDSDKGDYKLCLKGEDGREQEIQASNVKVEKPLAVKAGLKATKGEYVEGEDIELAFETTKPLADREKCIQLVLDTKTCTVTEEHYEIIEEVVSEEQVIYRIKIKACEAGKDDGTYKLRLFGKPGDKKSELSSPGQADIKIKSKPTSVLDSNWLPETTVKETEPVTLNVTIDKVLPNADSLVLTRDGKPVKAASIEVTKLDDNSCQITCHMPSAVGADCGNYKLAIAGKDKKAAATELAETKLVVEVVPFSVVAPLTADKAEYAPKEDAVLALTLSKKVESVEKCLKWTLNAKAVDMKAVELTEAVADNNNVSYTLRVKNVQLKKNDGEYTVRIREKAADKKELTESVRVKISDASSVKVLDSTWKPETSIKEGETLELSVTISVPLKDLKDIALYKDKAKVADDDAAKLSFENKKDKDGNEVCAIKVTLSETIPPDSGKYRLVLTQPVEQELALTNLKVEEIPLAIVDALKCDKPEYQVGEDIKVSFNVSKPLSDKDKCIAWQLNGKPLDVSAKNKQAQLSVEDKLTEGCVYTLTLKACELGKNGGEYTVKLRQKPADAKSEFYTGSVTVKINDGQLSILESNWKPETDIKEGEQLEYYVVVSQACNIKDLILLKDKNKLIDSEAVKLSIENKKAEDGSERCEIKMTIKDAIPPDSGKYRLVFVGHTSKKQKEIELGATTLKVEESPYSVVEALKSDKAAYRPGDDITLSIKLSKPLIDKQKNVVFALNGRAINIKDITLVEDISESLETVYSFIVKSAKPGLHDGEYTLKLCSKVNDVKSQFYSGAAKVAFEQDEESVEAVEFASTTLESSNMKPKEGETVKITAKLTKPMNEKAYKVQWYVNNEKADKSSRYTFNSPSDLETCFEVKPVRSSEEGALIQAAIVKLKDNAEVARATLQLEKNLKLLSDLKASKAKYEQDEPVEFSCEFSQMPLSLVLSKSPKEPREVLSCAFDLTKDSQKYDIDAYTVQVTKQKDGSYKLRVTNNKPSFREDNDKFWLALNGSEISTNECKIEIKQAGLKFAGDISAPKSQLVDSKDKLELCFSLNRTGVTVDEIKSDVQALLVRDGSKKEDTFLAGSFELALIDSDSAATTKFRLTMKQTVSENDSGEYTLKLKSSGDKSPNAVKINVENSNFFLSELPESIEIFEGELLKLELKCIKIVSKFSWIKDGANLTVKEDKYKKDKLVYAFEVKSAKGTDAGVYEFHCEEGSGKAFSKCTVTVKTKPEKLLKSLNDLGQVKVKEGETINLKVKFDREVKLEDLKLTLNDAEFVPTDHGDQCEIKLNKDNEYTVQIKGAKLGRDDGKYKLVSKNTESECSVAIEEKPLKFISELEHCRLKVLPDVFYASCDAEMAEKYPREASFECNLSSACTEVDWFINDTLIDGEIKEAKRYTVSHVLGKAHTLTISDCVPADTDSTVEIRLRNAKSPMKSKAQLKVEIMSMEQFIKVNMPLKVSKI